MKPILLILLALFVAEPSVAASRRLPPKDECARDASFRAYREKLRAAVARKDAAQLLALTSNDIRTSFGGGGGKREFSNHWQLNRPARSQVWQELGQVLALGCALDRGDAQAPSKLFRVVIVAFRIRVQPARKKKITRIAIALVPLLEWFERRRVPSGLAALICVILFIAVANAAVAAIVLPATEWVRLLPERIGRIRETLDPLFTLYADFEKFIDRVTGEFGTAGGSERTVAVETPNSMLDLLATSAPHLAIQLFFAILVIFFFLAGWTRMRKATITTRNSFDGAMTTARVIQQVVDATSTYLGTITLVNLSMGAVVALFLWMIDMPTPLMWGGIVAVLNYIPYLGPIASVLLLGLGGLMVFTDPFYALLPAVAFAGIHLVEANIITPALVGRRLTINPLLILVALSFWAWVWGTTGALLAVPLLIILKTVLDAAGKPDIAGFLFEEGTLTHHAPDDEDER